jgi:hypothetical protein
MHGDKTYNTFVCGNTTLLQVVLSHCEDLISTDLMQVDEKTCIKSANDNLQQA